MTFTGVGTKERPPREQAYARDLCGKRPEPATSPGAELSHLPQPVAAASTGAGLNQ